MSVWEWLFGSKAKSKATAIGSDTDPVAQLEHLAGQHSFPDPAHTARYLADADPEIRRKVAKSRFARDGSMGVFNALIDLLADDHEDIRRYAAVAMWEGVLQRNIGARTNSCKLILRTLKSEFDAPSKMAPASAKRALQHLREAISDELGRAEYDQLVVEVWDRGG